MAADTGQMCHSDIPLAAFGGEIADDSWFFVFEIRFDRCDPVMQKAITYGIRQRHVEIVFSGDSRKLALDVEKVVGKGLFKSFCG